MSRNQSPGEPASAVKDGPASRERAAARTARLIETLRQSFNSANTPPGPPLKPAAQG